MCIDYSRVYNCNFFPEHEGLQGWLRRHDISLAIVQARYNLKVLIYPVVAAALDLCYHLSRVREEP